MSASPFLSRHKRMLQYLSRVGLVPLFGVGAFTIGTYGLRILEVGGYTDRHGRFIAAASDPIAYWVPLGSIAFIAAFLAFASIVFLRTLFPPSKEKMASRDRQRVVLEQNHFAIQRMERELEKLIDQAKQENHAK